MAESGTFPEAFMPHLSDLRRPQGQILRLSRKVRLMVLDQKIDEDSKIMQDPSQQKQKL